MGYTHYWDRAAELPADTFAAAVEDCRKVLPATGIHLAGPSGCGAPSISANEIAFNGAGNQGCESFIISRCETPRGEEPRVFGFCKTNHQPYDLCVQITLILFAYHCGAAFVVSSDGRDADWESARRFCAEHLAYGQNFHLAPRH